MPRKGHKMIKSAQCFDDSLKHQFEKSAGQTVPLDSTGWASDDLGKRDGDSFELFDGYEDTRIFEIKTNTGTHHVIGNIDGGGSIIDSFGDDTGYEFDDVQRWMRFSPND